MRALTLSLQAFGPYVAEHTIDFRALEAERLFLIHGPTGAGKTTLLDAICFALYGQSSGGERDSRHLRSHFAEEQLPTVVRFEFELRGDRYRVVRTPEQFRPRKRGDGVMRERPTATLWKLDSSATANDTERVLASTWAEVSEHIEALLGLSYAHFRQVVLLPQGRFRDLLTATSRDRQQIFESLFATEFYRLIQERISGEAREARSRYDELQRSQAAALEYVQVQSRDALEAAIVKAQVETAELDVELTHRREAVQKVRERRERVHQAHKAQQELERTLALVAAMEAKAGEIDVLAERLERARRAAELAEHARGVAERRKAAQAAELQLRQARTEIERVRAGQVAASERVHSLGTQLAELGATLDGLTPLFTVARQAWVRSHAAALSAYLVEGEPCPVCGSNEHPAPATDARTVREKHDSADPNVVQHQLEVAHDRHRELNARLTDLRAELGQPDAPPPASTAKQIAHVDSGAMLELAEIASALQKLAHALKAIAGAVTEEHTAANRLGAELRAKQEAADLLARQCAQGAQELQLEQARLNENLQRAGFSSLDELRAAFLKPNDLGELERDLTGRRAALEAGRLQVAALRSRCDELGPPVDLAPIDIELRTLTEAASDGDKRHGALVERIKQLDAVRRKLTRIGGEIANAEARFRIVGRLAELTSGQNAKRLSLQRFVLATLLDDVLTQANLRLRRMSRGRFNLLRAQVPADMRAAAGLDLDVADAQTGVQRPVHTLSGGEGFLASLALALGLSDVVQTYAGGVTIETLFVDEGFGSLDAEALDYALEVLSDLGQHRGLIGIISHVEDLRERIQAQIVVRPGARGSTLQTVA